MVSCNNLPNHFNNKKRKKDNKGDIKAWFSSVRLIYSHSLLHNIISYRTGVNAHFLSH